MLHVQGFHSPTIQESALSKTAGPKKTAVTANDAADQKIFENNVHGIDHISNGKLEEALTSHSINEDPKRIEKESAKNLKPDFEEPENVKKIFLKLLRMTNVKAEHNRILVSDKMVNSGTIFKDSEFAKKILEERKTITAADFTRTNFRSTVRSLLDENNKSTLTEAERDFLIENLDHKRTITSLTDASGKPRMERTRDFPNKPDRAWNATHFTDADIKSHGQFTVFSRQELLERGINFDQTHTQKSDITMLGNQDQAFFALEPGSPKKTSSRFGANLYRVPIDHKNFANATMLLNDPLMGSPDVSIIAKHLGSKDPAKPNHFNEMDLNALEAEVYKYASLLEHNSNSPEQKAYYQSMVDKMCDDYKRQDTLAGKRFNDLRILADRAHGGASSDIVTEGKQPDQSNMLYRASQGVPAMLFGIVHDARKLSPEGQAHILGLRSDKEINSLINGLYRPQIQVPKCFSANENDVESYLDRLTYLVA